MDKQRALYIMQKIQNEGCMRYALIEEIGIQNLEDEVLKQLAGELNEAFLSIIIRLEKLSGKQWSKVFDGDKDVG